MDQVRNLLEVQTAEQLASMGQVPEALRTQVQPSQHEPAEDDEQDDEQDNDDHSGHQFSTDVVPSGGHESRQWMDICSRC